MPLGVQLGAGTVMVCLGAVVCLGQTSVPTPAPGPVPAVASNNPPVPAIAPLTVGGRAKYALHRSFGPLSLASGAFSSGFQTWRGRPEAWGKDWEGFGQRYGTRMARSVIGNGIDFGAGAALGTDPRYRRKGKGTFGERFKYALGASFYHYDRDGGRVPAISRFAGIVGSNIIVNQWMPPGDNRKVDVVRRCGQQLGWHVGWTLVREFLPDIKRKLGR